MSFAPRMSQTASARRSNEEMGRIRPVSGSDTTKSWTPCSRGPLLVAIVVQMIGESMGLIVWSLPLAPSFIMRAKAGSSPCSIIGARTSRSRPSKPRRRTRGPSSPAPEGSCGPQDARSDATARMAQTTKGLMASPLGRPAE